MFKDWKKMGIIAGVIAVILLGGLIYETVSNNILDNRSDKLISDLRADNQRIRKGLEDAEKRAGHLSITITNVRQLNIGITEKLKQSEGISEKLKRNNQQLKLELERSRGFTEGLGNENTKLGESIESSFRGSEKIEESNIAIRDSIGRAFNIFSKYENNP